MNTTAIKCAIATLLAATATSNTSIAFAAEDCLPFQTESTHTSFVNGVWKVVNNSEWMFSFGNRADLAERALKVIKTYGMSESCFVGRPNPPMSYLLTAHHKAPEGQKLAGEDCIAFNPREVEAKFLAQSKTWKVVQGDMWMLDFGNKADSKSEAEEAVRWIRTYEFDQQCFVGRPNPPFTYWKKTHESHELSALKVVGGLKVGKNSKEVNWNSTVTLSPHDAFLVSNGTPAFEVFYQYENTGSVLAAGFENQFYLDGQLVSRQYNQFAVPGVKQTIRTEAYLKPAPGVHTLTLKLDANHVVHESSDANNTAEAKVVFRGF